MCPAKELQSRAVPTSRLNPHCLPASAGLDSAGAMPCNGNGNGKASVFGKRGGKGLMRRMRRLPRATQQQLTLCQPGTPLRCNDWSSQLRTRGGGGGGRSGAGPAESSQLFSLMYNQALEAGAVSRRCNRRPALPSSPILTNTSIQARRDGKGTSLPPPSSLPVVGYKQAPQQARARPAVLPCGETPASAAAGFASKWGAHRIARLRTRHGSSVHCERRGQPSTSRGVAERTENFRLGKMIS